MTAGARTVAARMKSTAWIFPGQGSEEPEMGLALARADEDARALLDEASRACGLDVARALERGGRALATTEVLQPALLAVGLAAARALERRGARPDFVAGHSLGEVTAACFSARVAPRAAVELAALRGAALAAACARRPGGMLALHAETDEVEEALREHAGAAGVAAINAPGEIVVSGAQEAIGALHARFGVRATRLRVSGPWHSPLLAEAMVPLRAQAERTFSAAALHVPLVSAVTGAPIDASELPGRLAAGVVEPVRFVGVLAHLEAGGVTDVVVLAPSRTVRSLVRRTLGTRVRIHAADTPLDLDAIAAA
ncbi:MAG: ACP S-malonyltransferase [Sandaracinaceae bacterium]|nr:ACP S-malonyltransferase [Sandaracinaceae bacterium]